MTNFDQIKYARPDFEALNEKISKVVNSIKAKADTDTIDALLQEYYDELNHAVSMSTYIYIQSYLDGTDEKVSEEVANVMGQLSMIDTTVIYDAIASGSYKAHFEEKNGSFLLESQLKDKTLVSAGHEYLAKEQELMAKIHEFASRIEFDYEGKKVSASFLETVENSENPVIRHNARYAKYKGFADNGEKMGEFLGELVNVRHKIAVANGYKNYLEYANVQKNRYTYGEKELQQFCDNVKKYILPLVRRNNEALQKRLNLEAYTSDDTEIYFADGNAKPLGDSKFIIEKMQKMYDDMDPRLGAIFKRIRENGYINIEASDKKVTGLAFCVKMPEQKIPFIYANYLGEADNVTTVCHESGHAMQNQLSIDKYEDNELWGQVQDLSEVPSKTMELIAMEYADLFFGQEADKYIKGNLALFLEDITDYCRLHEFETFLYGCPDATPKERIDKFNELIEIYHPEVTQLHPELLEKGATLYKVFNIYLHPRYSITYSICTMAAIFLANEFKKDKKKGASMFIKLGEIGGSKDFMDALSYMGFGSPFSEETIREAADYLKTALKL